MDKSNQLLNKKPLVSIIMNCFNGEAYLKKSIESVLSQTYENWEIIFFDNQSTDNSSSIVKSYNDERIQYFLSDKHFSKLYEARNYALNKVKGQFIAFLDVDDYWCPEKLETQILLFQDKQVGAVYSNYWIYNEKKNTQKIANKSKLKKGRILDDLLGHYFVGLLTLVIRKDALESIGGKCNPNYHIIGDFDLVIRIASKWKLNCSQKPLAYFRSHENNQSKKHILLHADEFDSWFKDQSSNGVISSSINFYHVRELSYYLRGIHHLLLNERLKSFQQMLKLRIGVKKLRLFLGLLIPNKLLVNIRN